MASVSRTLRRDVLCKLRASSSEVGEESMPPTYAREFEPCNMKNVHHVLEKQVQEILYLKITCQRIDYPGLKF